jgi:hypothetical protein
MVGAFGVLIAFFVIVNVLALFGNEDAKQWVKDDAAKGGDDVWGCYIIVFVFVASFIGFFYMMTH